MSVPRDGLARLLAVLGCLLLPFALASAWTASTVTDTDAFVAATGPLAENPEIRAAVADELTSTVVASLDQATSQSRVMLERFLGQRGADTLSGSLQAPLTAAVRSVVGRVLESPGFPKLWRTATRAAHQDIMAVLQNEDPKVTSDGQVVISLDHVLAAVTQELSRQGVPGVDRLIPEQVQVGLPIAAVEDLSKARTGYQVLDRLGWWLPVLSAGLLAAGLLVARQRAALLRLSGRGAALGGAALVGVLWVAQRVLVDAEHRLDPAAAEALLDVLLAGLRHTVAIAILLGMAVTVLATVPTWLRTRSARAAGLVPTAVVGVVAAAALVLALA